MVHEEAHINTIKKYLLDELNQNIGGIDFKLVQHPEPPTVSADKTQAQIFLDEEEFETFGMPQRYMNTADIFIDLWHPFTDTTHYNSPATAKAHEIKRHIAKKINVKPPKLGNNAAWKQMLVRRLRYGNPYKKIKNMERVRVEVEVQYSEVVQ